jgi:hypothetical protein
LSAQTVIPKDYSAARERADSERTSLLSFPVLDAKPRRGRSLATLRGVRHPFWTYVCGVLVSLVVIAALSILTGLLITHIALRVHWLAADDERLVRFLAGHRSGSLTEASLVGSIMAGGVVLPIIAGIAAVIAAAAKHWRLAGFLLFALAIESGSYRATTLVVHRHRPEVHRLENLPVDASYPSGHTAASIAVYWAHSCSRHESRTPPHGSASGPSRRSSPCMWRSRGCTAACITRWTSAAECSSASGRCRPWFS